MKSVRIICMLACMSITPSAFAASANGTASAVVLDGSLTIVETTPMSFGTFSSSNTSGTIDSVGRTTGGVTSMGGAAIGRFLITGTEWRTVEVTTPPTITLTSGPNTMTASFVYTTNSFWFNRGPTHEEILVATLNVAANQPAGNYTGTYPVTVNYE